MNDDPSHQYDLVVIGSGPAGQRAAVQAAKLSERVAIVERMPSLGGVCILTGTIPSKTFREAVLMSTSSNEFRAPDRSSHSPVMSEVLERVQEVMMTEARVIRNQLSRNGVDLIRGTGRFISPTELEVRSVKEVRTITSENFLIAVGTRPTAPEGVPVDGEVVMTSDEVLALDHLPRSMAVVGGGVIGTEYATFFARLGVKVTLIDRNDRPVGFIDHEIVDELMRQMKEDGVTFHLRDEVQSISISLENRPHAELILNSGTRIKTDTVLYSIGRTAATDTLGLDRIGLKADDRGRIRVNDNYQTHVPNIWAAGDVIGFPALAATSSEQGRVAACRMFGVKSTHMGRSYPFGIYSIPEISMVGASEDELAGDGTEYVVGIARYREIARGQILGDDTGLFKMLFERRSRKLLGVHCIGTGATELVHVGQAVLKLGGGLDYFMETVFNYPTLAECYKVAAYDAANKLGYTPE
ncbi:MAG: Si-specific NAD(P)(+) transhydrogenase [Planctomycetota bacterium]|nr:Si-specific NAD(P)(+) transhydrogenase [Planctomycetota bacterium]